MDDDEKFIEKGIALYEQNVVPHLKNEDTGKYVFLDVKTGGYVMDANQLNAYHQARSRFPDALFYIHRVGYKAAHSFGGYMPRL